jgi:Na+/H+-translocating membrane pyrophosphatase
MSVEQQITHIKNFMPTVYGMIKAKAADIGNDAYGHVRAGLSGKANRFYAFEGGHVVGTPFDCPGITADISRYMVEFGLNACAIWAPVQSPAQASEATNAN